MSPAVYSRKRLAGEKSFYFCNFVLEGPPHMRRGKTLAANDFLLIFLLDFLKAAAEMLKLERDTKRIICMLQAVAPSPGAAILKNERNLGIFSI